jgi:hypothetical protein
MFRLIKFTFRAFITLKLMAIAFSAGMGVAYLMQMRAQYRTWGLVAGGNERGVDGDELVPEADIVETRGIDIDVAPDQVWPWLAQLGYGRGGWYSYPLFDRGWSPDGGAQGESADEILPEFQDLAEGDLVPTQEQGGFVARVVEPGEALVLYLDDAMTREQVQQIMGERMGDDEAATELPIDMPPYTVSWAFELEEIPGGRTRLIERLRASIEASDAQWRVRPLLAMGMFVFMRSQMEGIKQRAEDAVAGE